MNRLKDLACYLSGPIDFAENLGAGWRDDLTPFLEDMNLRVFDPLKHCYWGTCDFDEVKRPKMKEYQKNGQFKKLRREMKDVNHWDLRSVDLSSFLIVNYDNQIHMCGTYEEIFKANEQCKPVLLVCTGCSKRELSTWMYGRFPDDHMFESWSELKDYLTNINSDPSYTFTEADEKRWLFFNHRGMSESYQYRYEIKECEKNKYSIFDSLEKNIVVENIVSKSMAEFILNSLEDHSPFPK